MSDDFELVRTGSEGRLHRVAMGQADGDVFRCFEFRPLIVFGPQRSGKTTGIVIPAVLEWDGPCLTTSVRYDVLEKTIERRSVAGRPYIFDPSGMIEKANPSLAKYAVGWSPLDSIVTFGDAVRAAHALTETVDFSTVRNADYWASQSRLLLAPLLFAAASSKSTMGDLLSWLGLGANHLNDFLRSRCSTPLIDQETGELTDWGLCLRQIAAYDGMDSDSYSNIVSSAMTCLTVFTFPEVERRCRAGGFRLDAFFNGEPNTLYVCSPPHEQQLYLSLFTALVREVLTRAYERFNEVSEAELRKAPLMLCLDEAGNIARLSNLDTIATTAAGNMIQLVTIFHDMSQLQACYGEDRGRLIVNNHSGKLFLPGNSDPQTSEFLTSVLHGSEVRGGQTNRGWEYRDLRQLEGDRLLCIYDRLPPVLLERRSFEKPSPERFAR